MNILTSLGRKHLDGKKELSAHKDPVRFNPEFVYLTCVDNKAAALQNPLEVGAKVKCGTVLGIRPDFGIPVCSSVSGEITEIKKVFNKQLGRPTDFFVIKNDGKYEVEAIDPLPQNPTKEDVVNILQKAGIIGLGGAGFPSFIKYKTDAKIDHILINAAECEPYLTTDYVSTPENMKDIIYALNILIKVVGAKDAVIGIKKTKKDLIAKVKESLKGQDAIKVAEVPDVYPAGYERTLIGMVFKKQYKVLPSEVGIIVNNVQTMAAMGRLFKDGVRPSVRPYTFSGEALANPVNVFAPIGTMMDEIVEFIGGVKKGVEDITPVVGGPMMGRIIRQLNVPLAEADSGITVFDSKVLKKQNKSVPTQACLRCGECVDHCPMNLQPILMKGALGRKDMEAANKLGLMSCIECGLCSAICPSHIDLTDEFSKGKALLRIALSQKK